MTDVATTQTFDVLIFGDTVVEGNETFAVNLSNPTGTFIGRTQGVGTIVNDDTPAPPPVVSMCSRDFSLLTRGVSACLSRPSGTPVLSPLRCPLA